MDKRNIGDIYEKQSSEKFFDIFHDVIDDNDMVDFHIKPYGEYVFFCFGPRTLLNTVYVYNAFVIKRTKKCCLCEGENGDVSFVQVDKDKSLMYYCSECFKDEFFGVLGLAEESDEISIVENSEKPVLSELS